MKGFKDSTKMVKGHGAAKEHWSVPIARKAMGGSIVAPMGGGRPGGMGMNAGAARPIMPRPHVMPNMAAPKMKMARLAKGGRFKGNPEGNSRQRIGPYSENEAQHPTPPGRPGYKTGGKVKPKAGLAFMREPLCGGGRS